MGKILRFKNVCMCLFMCTENLLYKIQKCMVPAVYIIVFMYIITFNISIHFTIQMKNKIPNNVE